MVRVRWLRAADELTPVEPQPVVEPAKEMLRIAAEAVILQDEAEAVLTAVSHHGHLGIVAPRGGPLVHRFFALRDRLPLSCADPHLNHLREVLDTICYHHAMQVATALEFLACDGRSDELHNQVSGFTGLGAPARLLEDVYADLKERQITKPL